MIRRNQLLVRAAAAALRPALESLEARTLFAVAPAAAAITDGILDVTGTRRADDIVVEMNNNGTQLDVTANGTPLGSFNLSEITAGLRVSGGNGHDRIVVDAGVTLAATLLGGNGHDRLEGGSGDDTLLGGNGNDDLDGNAGVDQLDGGNATDVLSGGDDNDTLLGGNGRDTLDGGAGMDTLRGGNGRDSLDGGADADVIEGNGGRDSLRGGAGVDTFLHDPAAELVDFEEGETHTLL